MKPDCHAVTLWPEHAQFVLYDVLTPLDPHEEASLWSRPDERGAPLSIRRSEVAVSVFDDAETQVRLHLCGAAPRPLAGDWAVTVEASVLVESGVLGVREVMSDAPQLTVKIPAGQTRLRVHGRITPEEQLFCVQVWPE